MQKVRFCYKENKTIFRSLKVFCIQSHLRFKCLCSPYHKHKTLYKIFVFSIQVAYSGMDGPKSANFERTYFEDGPLGLNGFVPSPYHRGNCSQYHRGIFPNIIGTPVPIKSQG